MKTGKFQCFQGIQRLFYHGDGGVSTCTLAPSPHIAKRALMFLYQRPFSFIHVPALLLGYDYFLIWRITSTTLPSRYSTMQTTLSPVSMGLGTPVMDSASC